MIPNSYQEVCMEQKLETFLTLCQTMNYRRAAEACSLTQPAVTKQIQALEAYYGVRLFTYDGRRLQKTPQGELLEQYAYSWRYNAMQLRQALTQPQKMALRIGATKSIGDYILLPEIRRFLQQPEHELFFTVDNTAHLLEQLEAGALDFVVLEGVFDKQRYEHFLLRNEPFIGICAPEHPFSGQTVTLEAVFGQRLILREPGSGTRNLLEQALHAVGYSTAVFAGRVCISSFKLIRELVRDGCGVSFLYEAVVGQEAQFGHFWCPPLTGAHELNVVYLKHTGAGGLAHEFLGGI